MLNTSYKKYMYEQFLTKKYSEYGRVSRSGELYLPLNVGKILINDCIELNVSIIGVEFFHKKGDCIIPVTPINSLDCSSILGTNTDWKIIVRDCNKVVNDILEIELQRDKTLYFNPTFLEEQEWENTK